jgi:hypothetical protein
MVNQMNAQTLSMDNFGFPFDRSCAFVMSKKMDACLIAMISLRSSWTLPISSKLQVILNCSKYNNTEKGQSQEEQ